MIPDLPCLKEAIDEAFLDQVREGFNVMCINKIVGDPDYAGKFERLLESLMTMHAQATKIAKRAERNIAPIYRNL